MAKRAPADTAPHDEERIARITENLPLGFFEADSHGALTYVCAQWCRIARMEPDSAVGRGWFLSVHPDDRPRIEHAWNDAAALGHSLEATYRLANRSDVTVRVFLAPIPRGEGLLNVFAGAMFDVTAETTDHLRFVLDASNALGANLEIGAVCASLADIATARIADWCFIVLNNAEGQYDVRAIAHRDPSRTPDVERLRERFSGQTGSPLESAIRRNTPMLIPAGMGRELDLEMHSAMLVPISSDEGVVFGGMMLAASESERSYTDADLEVARMVARRAAAAIQTATAFDQERRRAERLQFIAEASDLLVQSADLPTMLERLTQFIVTRAADLACVVLAEGNDVLRTAACAHADPRMSAVAERLRGQRTLRPEAEESAIWMLSQHRTLLHKTVPVDAVLASMWEYLAPEVRALGIRSAITIPLFSRGETFGGLTVYWCTPERTYGEDDAQMFADVGRRLSAAIEHQRTLERERRIAEALQQALLPGSLPRSSGLQIAAHYRPSRRESDVGGDWYDSLVLQDGSILVSIGDVTGRGLPAAGVMGKLRQAIGMAALYEPDPARILDAVDFQLRNRRTSAIATAFVGIIDPSHSVLRFAGAGHPAPLLRYNGELFELRSTGLPLGLRDEYEPQQSEELSLEGCDLLVLYTDGLIESTRDLTFGEQRLAFLVTSEAISFARNPAEFLCDACVPPDAQDDTAVLTVLFGERTSWAFDAENAQAAHEARAQFVANLRERAPQDADISGAELVFGELVGNVVRHAPGPIEVQVEWADKQPTLHVIDRGRGFLRDPSLPADILCESGRGLYIVKQLTHALRIERIAGYGNHVAAALRL